MSSGGKNSLAVCESTKPHGNRCYNVCGVILMKPRIGEFAVIGILGLVIPVLLVQVLPGMAKQEEIPQPQEQQATECFQTAESQQKILLLRDDGIVEEKSLDDYITGVVLAEMPADFDDDALMAQAVAARTYTLRRNQYASKHDMADVCSSAACCQAYISRNTYFSCGGSEEDYNKISGAVQATSGQVLHYEGELIEATYFSCSGGMTEDAQAVWGAAFPYLIAQPSPGEEQSEKFTESVTWSKEQFLQKLGLTDTGDYQPFLGTVTYTQGDGVDTISICGSVFTGAELRKLLGLRSTSFLITSVGENVVITTKGYGHRVGLSQYGADAMAVSGSGYEEILAYYYPGTELVRLTMD